MAAEGFVRSGDAATGSTVRTVVPEPLTEETWAPFGWLPVDDTDPRDGQQRLEFQWDDAHVNIIGHTLEELQEVPGGLRCDELFHHDTHTQTIMPLDHLAVIAVAPASCALDTPAAMEEVHAFLIRPLEPLVLHRSTWHWGPYPVATHAVRLFNVQGLRYAEDNARADLAGRGLSFRVLLDGAASLQPGA